MEHWVSLYLASRFPNADQWWPTRGEDVGLSLRSAMNSPGKVILLEVKVPEATSAGHQLSIDTDQLQRYRDRCLPVFYVLPTPHWSGPLDPEKTSPPPAAGWWRKRSGNWFGNWTYVLSADDVAKRLSADKSKSVLYTIPYGCGSEEPRHNALKDAFLWKRFWREFRNCGPDGARRWRITRDRLGKIIVVDLADEQQVSLQTDEEPAYFEPLPEQLVVRPGDNLVVFHIDEKQLRT